MISLALTFLMLIFKLLDNLNGLLTWKALALARHIARANKMRNIMIKFEWYIIMNL